MKKTMTMEDDTNFVNLFEAQAIDEQEETETEEQKEATMIIIDTRVANAMAEYQKKHGKRMSMQDIKRIANVKEEVEEETEKQKQFKKLF